MTKPKNVKLADPELKVKWIDALRSGKYNQGQGRLKEIDSGGWCQHCCLGVLCELVAPEGFEKHHYGIVRHTFTNGKSVQESYPNETKMRELGLTRARMRTLAEMNDKGISFNKIADYIEETL